MLGGLSESVLDLCRWGSLGLLFITLIFWMPRAWNIRIRIVLAILQVIAGWFLMIFSWLYYVLTNGIDTL
jgi:hypothetical protein